MHAMTFSLHTYANLTKGSAFILRKRPLFINSKGPFDPCFGILELSVLPFNLRNLPPNNKWPSYPLPHRSYLACSSASSCSFFLFSSASFVASALRFRLLPLSSRKTVFAFFPRVSASSYIYARICREDIFHDKCKSAKRFYAFTVAMA